MENKILFMNTVTGKISPVPPDFINDARWLRSHNLVRHTEPKPAQVTNLPEAAKEIIDFSQEAASETKTKTNSKTK